MPTVALDENDLGGEIREDIQTVHARRLTTPSSPDERRRPCRSRPSILLSAAMDVEPGKDAIFNELYNDDHIRLPRQVPGIVSVARFKAEELTLVIGGERRTIVVDNEPA